MKTKIPFIELRLDKEKLGDALADCEVPESGIEAMARILPKLKFAERVIWACSGVKRCSSFSYKPDIDEGRVAEEDVTAMLEAAGLAYRLPDDCFPEPTVTAGEWDISHVKANMNQPYRKRDKELARWFDYPACCVDGYRKYFDRQLDAILSAVPFKNITDAKGLDEYVYINGVKDEERFKEVGEYYRQACTDNPELKPARRKLIEPIREELNQRYDSPAFNLLLHFCFPVHDYGCGAFSRKANEMYDVLRKCVNEDYANLVVSRSILMDHAGICF